MKWEEFLEIQVKSLAISLQLRPITFAVTALSSQFRMQKQDLGFKAPTCTENSVYGLKYVTQQPWPQLQHLPGIGHLSRAGNASRGVTTVQPRPPLLLQALRFSGLTFIGCWN